MREESLPRVHDPEMEAVPEDDLPKYANRMERLRRQVQQQRNDASLVGDEVGAEALQQQIDNVENLQLSLPRPTI